MARLSDQQAASLLAEIAASMKNGVALPESMRRLQDARLGKVAVVAGSIANRLEQGSPISAALAAELSPQIPGVGAALEVANRDGNTNLLVRMSNLLLRRSEAQRETRFSWFYPICLLVTGYLVGGGVMVPFILANQERGIQWPDPVYQTALWAANGGLAVLAVLMLAICAGWILIARGRRYSAATRREIFCRSMADQISCDVPTSQAITSAAEIADESELAAIVDPTLSDAAVARLMAPPFSHELPADLPPDDKQLLIAKFNYLASIYHEQARRRSQLWSRIVPRTATVIIGSSLILGYAYWIIRPVYREVATW